MATIDLEGVRVEDFMSTAVLTVDPNHPIIVADRLGKLERIRHLPVVDEGGELVGIVSQRDIFHSALLKTLGYGTRGTDRMLEMHLVKEVMTTGVVTTTPDTPLSVAARLMEEKGIGCLPVVDGGGRLVGLLSERDLVTLVADGTSGA